MRAAGSNWRRETPPSFMNHEEENDERERIKFRQQLLEQEEESGVEFVKARTALGHQVDETEVEFVNANARMGLGRSSLQPPRLLLNQGTPLDDDQGDDFDLSAQLGMAEAIVDFAISKSHHMLDDEADDLSAKLKVAKVFVNCAVSTSRLRLLQKQKTAVEKNAAKVNTDKQRLAFRYRQENLACLRASRAEEPKAAGRAGTKTGRVADRLSLPSLQNQKSESDVLWSQNLRRHEQQTKKPYLIPSYKLLAAELNTLIAAITNGRASAARAGHRLADADSSASLEDAELNRVIALSKLTVRGAADSKVFPPRPGGAGRALAICDLRTQTNTLSHTHLPSVTCARRAPFVVYDALTSEMSRASASREFLRPHTRS
jgi:hypothetical protein